MSQKPSVYAELLRDRMEKHQTRCVLLNTGWSGGPYGVGARMSLKHTRALLDAALDGEARRRADRAARHPRPHGAHSRARACPTRSSTRATPGTDQDAYDVDRHQAARHVPRELRRQGLRRTRHRRRPCDRVGRPTGSTHAQRHVVGTDLGQLVPGSGEVRLGIGDHDRRPTSPRVGEPVDHRSALAFDPCVFALGEPDHTTAAGHPAELAPAGLDVGHIGEHPDARQRAEGVPSAKSSGSFRFATRRAWYAPLASATGNDDGRQVDAGDVTAEPGCTQAPGPTRPVPQPASSTGCVEIGLADASSPAIRAGAR